jgi:CBS domain containing-hemolysin-like protein
MDLFSIIIATVLFILFALSFFFSLSETAIIALSKLRLRHLVAKGVKRAQVLERLVLKLDRVITAILIGNNLVNISISVIMMTILVIHFGYKWGTLIATVASALFILVFCEITPKILATKHTEKLALATAPLMEVFIRVFHPIIAFFTGASNFILKVFRVSAGRRSPLITEEELRLMIEVGKEEGVLSDEERKMLHRIFEFGDTKVNEVMIPKEKMVGVNIRVSEEEVLNIFVEEGHARLPVYQDSIDTVIGVIYAHDLLYILKEKGLFVLQDLVHEACYIPPSARVNEVLKKFQLEKIQIAIVVNEQKKTLGLVTLEDLVEEIVGEIEEKPLRRSRKK